MKFAAQAAALILTVLTAAYVTAQGGPDLTGLRNEWADFTTGAQALVQSPLVILGLILAAGGITVAAVWDLTADDNR